MIIVARLRLCSTWYVLYVLDGAFGLGSFWSIDACYEVTLNKTCWNMKFVHRWDWQLACVGFVEILYAITYMLGCYVSCFELLTCLNSLEILVLKFKKQAKWREKIEMGLYCPTSRYRDCFQLHIWMNLSFVVDAKTIVLYLLCATFSSEPLLAIA